MKRYQSLFERNSNKKQTLSECVIVGGTFDKADTMLVKNRDRNYVPNVKIYRDGSNGIEKVYIYDMDTGWLEGMNEYGIGIVNSALLVTQDEKEYKIAKSTGAKSADGKNILQALNYTSLDDAIKVVTDFNGGVNGHTLIGNHLKCVRIEKTSRHDPVVYHLKKDEYMVRTNHGYEHSTGYTLGDPFLSSKLRKSSIENAIEGKETLKHLLDKLIDIDPENKELSPFRTEGNLKTTSQLGMDLFTKTFYFRPVDLLCNYEGIYRKNWPEDKEPKIEIKVEPINSDYIEELLS